MSDDQKAKYGMIALAIAGVLLWWVFGNLSSSGGGCAPEDTQYQCHSY